MLKYLSFTLLILSPQLSSAQVSPDICQKAQNTNNTVQTETGPQKVSFLSHKEVQRIFKKIKHKKYKIPYLAAQGSNESCRFRAHKIAEILNDKFKVLSLKSFIEAKELKDANGNIVYNTDGSIPIDEPLIFTSEKTNETYAWADHTANAVCVKHKGKIKLFVIDLSLFDQAVSHETWVNALTLNKGQAYYGRSYLTTMYNLSRTHHDYPEVISAFDKNDLKLTEEDLASRMPEHNRMLELLKSSPAKLRKLDSFQKKSPKVSRQKICKNSKKYKKTICF